jgi:hypothetical protein
MALAERRDIARATWTQIGDLERYEAVRRELSEQCAAFGPDTLREVLTAIKTARNIGTLDQYLAAVLAVAVPILQARVAAVQADADARRRAADRREQHMTSSLQWSIALRDFIPTTAH